MTSFNPLSNLVNDIDTKSNVTTGIEPLVKAWREGAATRNPSNPVRAMLRKWSVRYLGFVRRRFDRASKGDGTWQPLALSTLLKRRHGGAGGVSRKVARTKGQALSVLKRRGLGPGSPEAAAILGSASILRDTGILFASLSPGAAGSLQEDIPGGIRVGFAPIQHGDDRLTIQRLAAIHDGGGSIPGRPPARPILVEPDQTTVKGMIADAKAAVAELLRISSSGQKEVRG